MPDKLKENPWKYAGGKITVSREAIEHAAKDNGYCSIYDYLDDLYKSAGIKHKFVKDYPAIRSSGKEGK
jgi:hypothetical protein